MRGIVILALLGALAYGAFNYYHKHTGIVIAEEPAEGGGTVKTISHRGMSADVTELGDFEIELRVFGANSNLPRESGFLLMTDILVASPMNTASQAFSRYLCERQVADKAPQIQLIVQDEAVRHELDRYHSIQATRKCAYINGTSYQMNAFYEDGEPISMTISGGNGDPYKLVLVKEFKYIPCR